MADRPILFSAPMVRALLEGRKTQTRRAFNPQPYSFTTEGQQYWNASGCVGGRICISDRDLLNLHKKPNFGDRLYVCETHYRFGHWEPDQTKRTAAGRQKWKFVEDSADVLFEAPESFRKGRHHQYPFTPAWHQRLGRFMFRKHSRTTLIVTDVRIERLQDISEMDSRAEGAWSWKETWDDAQIIDNARDAYCHLWEEINGEGSWESNPWVAAYTFRVIKSNIDKVAA